MTTLNQGENVGKQELDYIIDQSRNYKTFFRDYVSEPLKYIYPELKR